MNRKLMIPVLMALIAGSCLFASESFAAQGSANFDKAAISQIDSGDMTGNGLETGWWGHGGHRGGGHGC